MPNKQNYWNVAALHRASDGKTTEVVAPKQVLASSEQHARTLVAREIGDEWVERLDEVEVVVTPFGRG